MYDIHIVCVSFNTVIFVFFFFFFFRGRHNLLSFVCLSKPSCASCKTRLVAQVQPTPLTDTGSYEVVVKLLSGEVGCFFGSWCFMTEPKNPG